MKDNKQLIEELNRILIRTNRPDDAKTITQAITALSEQPDEPEPGEGEGLNPDNSTDKELINMITEPNPKQPPTAEEILNDNWILSAICITGNHSHTGGDVQSEMEKAMHTHTAEHLRALDRIIDKKLGQAYYMKIHLTSKELREIIETYIKNNLGK